MFRGFTAKKMDGGMTIVDIFSQSLNWIPHQRQHSGRVLKTGRLLRRHTGRSPYGRASQGHRRPGQRAELLSQPLLRNAPLARRTTVGPGYNTKMRFSRTTGIRTAILAILLANAACSQSPEDPDFFTNRLTLPSCGEIKKTNASSGSTFERSQVECMESSRTAGGSEFTLRSTTTEGDEIVNYIRILPNVEDVEIIVDKSQDEYSEQGWTSYSCSIPELTENSITDCMATR